MYICNSFSLNMLPEWVAVGSVTFRRLTLEQARTLILAERTVNCEVESAIGHAGTAAVFSQLLGIELPVNRINASLTPSIVHAYPCGSRHSEEILVGQYRGPRLPEGATTLPEGAEIQWILATFREDDFEEFAPYADEEEK